MLRLPLLRAGVLGATSLVLASTGGSQPYHQREAYRGTVGGVYLRITSATDDGLQIDAGKPPDHVLLSPILPDAATAWADSAVRLLDASDSTATAAKPVTFSSGLLVDSAHNAVSLDRVLGGPSPHCALFFVDGANMNHVEADLPCGDARELVASLRTAATTQLAYDRSDSATTAAAADRELREESRRRDSLALAARAHFKRDSAAGAIP
jgi:hypothetical protein